MFTERKMICVYLILFLIPPLIDKNRNKKIFISWIVCTCLLFIFPFFPNELKDCLPLM